jgi:NAD(P)H dehydrogenase (quinone)
MRKPKILVTSAAGNTGMPTTLQLLEKGYSVRAWVRSNDHRAKQLKEAGADIFVGDLYSITDMRAAMTGVQRAYHCAPTAPNALHFGTVFSIAAQEKKLEHVVMLSQWLSDPKHPSVFTRETWLNERVLNLLPDTTLTVINTGWFAENYFFVLETAAQLGIMPLPLGDGDVKNNAPPSNNDIAAVNAATLVNPEAHAGKVYRPTGPKLLSPNEIATAMGQALKRKVKYQEIPESMLLKALKVQGFGEAMPTQLRIYAEEYRRGAFAVHAPSNVVKQLTGREPEDFETIARHTIAKRADAVQTTRNKLRAIANFMKILATAKIDPDLIERRRDHVLLKSPGFVRDSETWLKTHDPDAGYSPDRFDASLPLSVIRETRA